MLPVLCSVVHRKTVMLEGFSDATLGGFPANWAGQICFGGLVIISTIRVVSPDKIESSESAPFPLQVL